MPEEKGGLESAIMRALLTGWPYRVEGKWYYNQKVTLDGYQFVKCRFDRCTLETAKGSFTLENCYLWECGVVYSAEAWKVARLYVLQSPEAFNEAQKHWPSMLPVLNKDGTITIR